MLSVQSTGLVPGTAPGAGADQMQRVRVLRPFMLSHDRTVSVGDEVDVPMLLARELQSYNKVEFVRQRAPAPAPVADTAPAPAPPTPPRQADQRKGAGGRSN